MPSSVEHREEWVSYCAHLNGDGTHCDCAPYLLDVVDERDHYRKALAAVVNVGDRGAVLVADAALNWSPNA